MIGYKKDDGTIVLNKTKYSQTTSIHQGLIRRANTGKIEELPEKEFNEAYGKKVTEDYKKPRDFQSTDQILPSKTIDISAVKERNDKGGYHFFERSNMRFFNSKVNRNAYVDKKAEKAYFVTSEKHDDYYNNIHQPRKFTVRKVDLKTGNVDTAGEFQAYTDNKTATKVAKDLAQQ